MAKGDLKSECIRLRQEERLSFKEIHERTGASRGSLSYWLRNFPLTDGEKKAKHLRGQQRRKMAQNEDHSPPSMIHRTPKLAGSHGEIAVAAHIAGLGYPVFKEMGDSSAIDLIVDHVRKLVKVQVKSTLLSNNCASLRLVRSSLVYNYKAKYEEDDVDVFALYVRNTGHILYVPASVALSLNRMTFRSAPARNGQTKNVHLFEDYLDFEKAVTQASVTQPAEYPAFNRQVLGSNPSGGIKPWAGSHPAHQISRGGE